MSNFNGHYKGGLVGASVSMISIVSLGETNYINICAVGLSTLTFSLFPDIDIKSTPSKIFYALFLVYLAVLYHLEQYKLATLSSMIAISPQITKHRGIFHSHYAAILIPIYPIYFYYNDSITKSLFLSLWAAGTFGYYIHLALDKKLKL